MKEINNFEQFRGICQSYIPSDKIVFKCFFSDGFDRYTCILIGSEQPCVSFWTFQGINRCEFKKDKDANPETMSLFEGLNELKKLSQKF